MFLDFNQFLQKEKTVSYYHKSCGGLCYKDEKKKEANFFRCFSCLAKGDLDVEVVQELEFKKFHNYLRGVERHYDAEVGDLYKKFKSCSFEESAIRVRYKMKEMIGRRAMIRFFLTGIEKGVKSGKE